MTLMVADSWLKKSWFANQTGTADEFDNTIDWNGTIINNTSIANGNLTADSSTINGNGTIANTVNIANGTATANSNTLNS